jgi:hypothetical protein
MQEIQYKSSGDLFARFVERRQGLKDGSRILRSA